MTLRDFGKLGWFWTTWSLPSQSCKGIYRLLTDADGLAAVEELEVVLWEKTEKLRSQVWNMTFVPSRKYGVLETIPCDRCWPHIMWPWQSQIVLCFCHCSILSSCHNPPCTSHKQSPCTASFSLGFRKLCRHGLLISAKKAAQEPSQRNLSNLQLPMLAGMVPKSPPMTQGPPSNVAVVGMLELLKGLGESLAFVWFMATTANTDRQLLVRGGLPRCFTLEDLEVVDFTWSIIDGQLLVSCWLSRVKNGRPANCFGPRENGGSNLLFFARILQFLVFLLPRLLMRLFLLILADP